ncbi:MAG: Bifunctional chorismate mutase/prephenate dehydratase [Chlamydiae bacterium]|nr:Bifunctional chorismate mutase/prephenate dehydratase [Chlamydiota bacterium]
MKIVTLGPEGTFSHEAALTLGDSIVFVHAIEDVFDVLEQNLVDVAIVPLENSVSGTVFNTLDSLLNCEYKIQGEIILPVVHHLVGFCASRDIKRLYTHPHSYEQCRKSLQELFMKHSIYDELEIVFTTSNSMSAHKLLEDKEGSSALLSTKACELYEIPIICEKMQDMLNNQTRFIELAHHTTQSTGLDRTSVILTPHENRKGLLSDILSTFSKYRLNLTKIESRPSRKGLGNYFFYIDFEGHIEDTAVQKALEEVQSISPYQFLGSYPRQF